jgi:hypothetical protein
MSPKRQVEEAYTCKSKRSLLLSQAVMNTTELKRILENCTKFMKLFFSVHQKLRS